MFFKTVLIRRKQKNRFILARDGSSTYSTTEIKGEYLNMILFKVKQLKNIFSAKYNKNSKRNLNRT